MVRGDGDIYRPVLAWPDLTDELVSIYTVITGEQLYFLICFNNLSNSSKNTNEYICLCEDYSVYFVVISNV